MELKERFVFTCNFFSLWSFIFAGSPQNFQLIIQFLRGFIATGEAQRFSDLSADRMWAGKSNPQHKPGLPVVEAPFLLPARIWFGDQQCKCSITAVHDIFQYQKCLEIKGRKDLWGYLSYYAQNTGLFLALFFEKLYLKVMIVLFIFFLALPLQQRHNHTSSLLKGSKTAKVFPTTWCQSQAHPDTSQEGGRGQQVVGRWATQEPKEQFSLPQWNVTPVKTQTFLIAIPLWLFISEK